MFAAAVLLGAFGYSILILGLTENLTPGPIRVITLVYLTMLLCILLKRRRKTAKEIRTIQEIISSPGGILLSVLLTIALVVNLIGALGPEIHFDSLWYHLTLPKMYLMYGKFDIFPNPPFFHSALPKLVELFYVPALVWSNEIFARLIHLSFGLATAIIIAVRGVRSIGRKGALLAAVIFYADLSISWLSQSAYIDLGRTFFETITLFLFLDWLDYQQLKTLLKVSIVTGLAISTKLFAVGSLLTFFLLTFIFSRTNKAKNLLALTLPALFLSSIWFILAYLKTGNPVYPLFSGVLDQNHALLVRGPLDFILTFPKLSFDRSVWDSAISPTHLILLPLTIYSLTKSPELRPILWYFLLNYTIWFFIPPIGGTRFIVPYLPALSLLSASIFNLRLRKLASLKKLAFITILVIALVNSLVRGYLNKKYLLVITGQQKKYDFLHQNVNEEYVFLDENIAKIVKSEPVFIIGGHSLYYANFSFFHKAFANNSCCNYILTHQATLPSQFSNWPPVYTNPNAKVILYKRPTED